MKFQTSSDEAIFAAEITPDNRYMFNQDLKTGLSIIWNAESEAMFMVDKEEHSIEKDCMLFLTEYHMLDNFEFSRMNIIQFNRPFYCVEDDDSEVGCKGLLFFGASQIPKIQIEKDQQHNFSILWQSILMEIDETDDLKLEMLRLLLKRFLILSLRIYKKQRFNLELDDKGFGLIREYNYLVEKHFRELSKVSDYADLLHKSPKTLANFFNKYYHKTPLQIINERRFLEAKRQLVYTDKTIQEIADFISFKDIQSFSHFFHSMSGLSPSAFKEKFQNMGNIHK